MKWISNLLVALVLASCARSISDTTLKVGTGADTANTIEADIGLGANNPQIVYNTTSNAWQSKIESGTLSSFFTAADFATHEADTTNVHGITDTSTLITEDNTKTMTNKTLTSPVLNTGVSGTAIKDAVTAQSSSHLLTENAAVDYADTKIAASIGTTKGDLLAYTGAAWTRVPVGTNGQFLQADSAASNGVSYTNGTSGSTINSMFVRVHATTNTTQNCWGTTAQKIEYGTEVVDTDNAYDPTTGLFTVPTGVTWCIFQASNQSEVDPSGAAGEAYELELHRPAGTAVALFSRNELDDPNTSATADNYGGSIQFPVTAGEVYSVAGDGPRTLQCSGSPASNYFSVTCLRPL